MASNNTWRDMLTQSNKAPAWALFGPSFAMAAYEWSGVWLSQHTPAVVSRRVTAAMAKFNRNTIGTQYRVSTVTSQTVIDDKVYTVVVASFTPK